MKKLSVITSAIAAVLLSVGVSFKVLHWPYGGWVLLCAAIVAIVAGICWLVSILKQNECKMYGVCSVVTLLLAALAVVFKLLHFPGGSYMVLIAGMLLIPVMIIWTACCYLKK